MIGYLTLLRELVAPFMDLSPGAVWLEDCEGLSAHLRNEEAVAETRLARHFLGIRQALGRKDLDNVFRLPGTGNPAGGPADVKSDMVPLFRMLQLGTFRPGAPRPFAWSAIERKRGEVFFRHCAP